MDPCLGLQPLVTCLRNWSMLCYPVLSCNRTWKFRLTWKDVQLSQDAMWVLKGALRKFKILLSLYIACVESFLWGWRAKKDRGTGFLVFLKNGRSLLCRLVSIWDRQGSETVPLLCPQFQHNSMHLTPHSSQQAALSTAAQVAKLHK